MREIADNLVHALERIEDFQSVQSGRGADELREAVELLQESVGINDDERVILREHFERIRGSERAPGHVLLGVIVGLMAAEGF